MQWAISGFRRKLGRLFDWRGWPTVVAAATAAAAIAALYFSSESVGATGDQIELARQEQVSERFNSAVEKLASDGTEIHIGGIYLLEQLARDSPEEHQKVFAMLSAFLRSQALLTPGCGPDERPVDADTQVAIAVIGRRDIERDEDLKVDLTKVCLQSADLSDASLGSADLEDANLSGARLHGADLAGAILAGANLNVDVKRDLEGANLRGADLSNADLAGAELIGVDMSCATAEDADLGGEAVRCTNLSGADLSLANLSGANLDGVVDDPATRWPNDVRPPK